MENNVTDPNANNKTSSNQVINTSMDSPEVQNSSVPHKLIQQTSLPSPHQNPGSGSETIYELARSPFEAPNSSHVVSERVQTLASQIYNELQKIMSRFSSSDEDDAAVSGLMPLIVNVLESLDLSLIENQQLQVELELCKDDNEQLVVAFEKEKNVKKRVDQKLLEMEFQAEEEKQALQVKVDSMENVVKILELKSKNATDHSARLEEKENEMKAEYNKLHTRYTELLRSHCDLMERVKILIGNEDFSNTSSGPASLTAATALKNFLTRKIELDQTLASEEQKEPNRGHNHSSPGNQREWIETELSLEDASIIEDIEDIPRDKDRVVGEKTLDSLQPQSLSVADSNFFGMEKEVENLITENNELLATKNALNIVKDDLIAKVDALESELSMMKDENQQLTAVKNRLRSRNSQLEDELKKIKEENDEMKVRLDKMKEDDEEGIPMVQRKRFTRLEMARVLMERNQYKEKLIELQEAVRWTELIRASKSQAEGERKSVIWKFGKNLSSFSNLFASPQPSRDAPLSSPGQGGIRYTAPSSSVTPALDAMRRRARAQQGTDVALLMDSDLSIERARAMRNVRAHVNRGNGDRVHAYGWSIAVNPNVASDKDPSVSLKQDTVPVPTYCRPLSGDDVGMKIWCACAVDLTGGDIDFPSSSPGVVTESPFKQIEESNRAKENSVDHNLESVRKGSDAIAALETELKQAMDEEKNEIPTEKNLSTFVWICSVSQSKSKVTIINIRSNPSEVLDSFVVRTHLLCITSVPGAKVTDVPSFCDVDTSVVGIKKCSVDEVKQGVIGPLRRDPGSSEVKIDDSKEAKENDIPTPTTSTLEKLNEFLAYTEPASSPTKQDIALPSSPVYQPMSSRLPTVWMGGQNGVLYVHSSIAQWSHCLASLKLKDSILSITHHKGRVFVALANGHCCVFCRSKETGEWDFTQYYTLDIGLIVNSESSSASPDKPPVSTSISVTSSIRCVEVARSNVWMGYRNLVYIVDPLSLKIVSNFPLHPRKETQVRQLTALGDGVWCSLRLDSTLRLYSAIKPFHHLQDIDIEPYVGKMLSPKAFSFIRITALKASQGRLWIGTANGVVLSIPCEKTPEDGRQKRAQSLTTPLVVSDSESDKLAVSTFIPTCNSTAAQLSFHGHRDAVKFFVCTKNLILSGGDGYVDFRVDEEDPSVNALSRGDRSHLIVWEVMNGQQSVLPSTSS